MATYKRRLISLMILVIGLFLSSLGQLTIEGKNIECIGEEKTQEETKGYKAYFDLAERNLEVTTSGQYYVTCTTTSTPYRIIVENAVRNVEIIMQNVNIDVSKQRDTSGIEIHGSAILTLKGTNSVMGGRKQTCIAIAKYGDLTFSEESTGSLSVEGGEFASAIGGTTSGNGGSLYIKGGNIRAYTKGIGAVIGSIASTQDYGMKYIAITGGDVYCEVLGSGGAAIGGGMNSTVPNIEINGGHVVVKAGRDCRAIGSGSHYTKKEGCLKIGGGQVIVYQGETAGKEYIAPIKLDGNTILESQAVIISIERMAESRKIDYVTSIDVSELNKKVRLIIEEIGVDEEINLKDKGYFINVYSPSKKYCIVSRDEESIYLQSESNETKEQEDKESILDIENKEKDKESVLDIENKEKDKESTLDIENEEKDKENALDIENKEKDKENALDIEKQEKDKVNGLEVEENNQANEIGKNKERRKAHNDEASVFKLSSDEEPYAWNSITYHKGFDWNKLSPTNKSYYISYGVKPK